MKKSGTVKPQRSKSSKEIVEYSHARIEGLRRVLEARKAAEAAFDHALASSKSGKNMLQQRKQLANALARACQKLKDGTITRGQIDNQFAKTAHAFEKKYRPLAEKEWLKIAKRAPTVYEMYHALNRDEKPPLVLEAQILYFLGIIFQHPPQNTPDTGTSQQALMQPIDVSATSFDLQYVEQDSDGLGFPSAIATPQFGAIFVSPMVISEFNVPGVASDWCMVGAKFTFPGGPTTFTVSADINFNADVTSYAVFGGAVAGTDLALRIVPNGGSPQTTTLPLLTVVAPALWGAEKKLSEVLTITQTLTLDDPASQSLTVFAGGHGHAEGEGTFASSFAILEATVDRIAVHAM
jgi:hypothetical protein